MGRVRRLLLSKGHALVWALCCMMVITVIAAAVLTAGAASYHHALGEAMRQKSLLLARSGITYAVQMIRSGDPEWCPDGENFVSGTVVTGTKTLFFDENRKEPVLITYETVDSRLKVTACATAGEVTEKSCALFSCTESDGEYIWEFTGYAG